MALPSQMQSSPVRGRYVYRRRRKRRGPVLFVTLLVAAGVVFWIAYGWDGEGDSGEVAPTSVMAIADPLASNVSREVMNTTSAPPRWTPGASETVIEDVPASSMNTPAKVSEVPQTPREVPVVVKEVQAPVQTIDIPVVQEVAQEGPLGMAAALIEQGRFLEARTLLTQAIDSGALEPGQGYEARQMLGMLNDELVFGSDVFEGDPWASEYTVKPGDSLSRIVSREDLKIDWRLLQMINGLDRPEKIQVGQTIKILHGPFHAEVSKTNHQLDLFMGEGPERAFVKSYTVGLGQFDSTPTGRFRVRKGQKIVNPTWTNPRTGEFYPSDDPENPIGEYWLGLEGLDATNKGERGFGIHGTIEPESIGTDSSMGCVRLRDGEIDTIYALMSEGVSTLDVRQ
ncbi:MAG: L,D-transpeptidase family protein [Phycisphaerales bacterium]|nr:L,D-transpeptidase family protein [Phycisphaerales bacterium]